MGKKKKNKAKRLLREQALQLEKTQNTAPAMSAVADSNRSQAAPTPQPQIQTICNAEAASTGRDIRKILLNVAILAVIIVAVYLVNIKSDFILKLGAWLSNALNINV